MAGAGSQVGLQRGPGKGRPKGSKNKTTLEVRTLASKILASAKYRKDLQRRAESGKLAPAVEVALWHYAFGKPREQVEAHVAVDYRWLTDEDEAVEDAAPALEAHSPLALVPPATEEEDEHAARRS